jgi:two-component system sensor histidine kinase DegS
MTGPYTPKSMEAPPAGTEDVTQRIAEAQEAERARIAQEIHDGPAQALANAIFGIELVERLQATDPAAAADELVVLRERLERELTAIRDIISDLRPSILDQLGLDEALRDAATDFSAATGIEVATDLTAPTDQLDDHVRIVVLRVTQEALQNVRKHAAATKVLVRTELGDDDRPYILEIRDDGRGFDIEAATARGRRTFGLQFMRERAELIHGRLDVRSRPDGGTVIRLAVPTTMTGVEENR